MPAFAVRAAEPHASGVEEWVDAACERFYLSRVGAPSGSSSHMFVARAVGSGELVGACEGSSWFGGTYCSRLAVAPAWRRGKGVGAALVAALEREARASAARSSVLYLCTLSYQDGLAVYPRLGFATGNTVEGLPRGLAVTWLSKPIAPEGSSGDDGGAAPPAAERQALFTIESLHAPASGVPLAAEELAAREGEAQAFLRATFVQHSHSVLGNGAESGWFAFAFEAVAEGSSLERVGAITGMAFWGMLIVSLVVVEKPWRSRGVGSALLEAALRLGREKGCTVCEVETMTFQVRKRHTAVACALTPARPDQRTRRCYPKRRRLSSTASADLRRSRVSRASTRALSSCASSRGSTATRRGRRADDSTRPMAVR